MRDILVTVLVLCLCQKCQQSLSWQLPNVNFVMDLALERNSARIVTFVPDNIQQSKIVRQFVNVNSLAYRVKELTQTFVVVSSNSSDRIVRKKEEDLLVFILDDKHLDKSIDIFVQLYNNRSRSDQEAWFLDISPLRSVNEARSKLASLNLDLDDDLHWFILDENGILVKLWEVYRILDYRPMTINSIGNWTSNQGLILSKEEKWQRRRDMQGAFLRIEAMPSAPYIIDMIPVEGQNGTYTMTGMFADVFHNLKDTLNFTFILRKPPDENWGSLQSDQTWNGMVRQLQDLKSDIAVADLTVTLQRSTAISFSQAITQIHHRLFVKNPEGTYNFKAYTEPLYYKTWIFLFLFCLVVPPILHWTVWFGQNNDVKYDFTLSKSYVFLLSALTTRGWSSEPSFVAARCAFLSLMTGAILIYWHWEAMLISYLATRVVVLPFQGIKTLLDQSDFRIMLQPDTAYEDAFKLSTDPVWSEAWNSRIKSDLNDYEGYSDLVPLLFENPSLALYENYYGAIVKPEYVDCKILATPSKYDFKPYAFGFQKDSPLLGLFNFYLKEMREKGAMKKILNKYDSGPQICPDSSGQPLGMDNCFTAFMVLVFGLGLALLLMGIEWLAELTGKSLPVYETLPPQIEDEKDKIIKELTEQNRAILEELSRYKNQLGNINEKGFINKDILASNSC